MGCCKCKTQWMMIASDLEFSILKIREDEPTGLPPSCESQLFNGEDYEYEWHYSGKGPCDEKIISTTPNVALELHQNPQSNCNCINSNGGIAGPKSPFGEELVPTLTAPYGVAFPGYWQKKSGPSICPNRINGTRTVTYLRQFKKKNYLVLYYKGHLCGAECPGDTKLDPPEYDKVDHLIDILRKSKPVC